MNHFLRICLPDDETKTLIYLLDNQFTVHRSSKTKGKIISKEKNAPREVNNYSGTQEIPHI
jgi:hypothetical protein